MFSARFLRSITKFQRPEDAQHFLRQDRYWRPEVAERLLARVDDLISIKPKQALGLAELAMELVKRIRDSPGELRGHAHCSLATASRATGNLIRAEDEYQRAEKLAQGGSTALKAMIARQKAILLIEQGNSRLALKTARRAVELDRARGVFPTKSLIAEGIVRGFQKDFPGSCSCFMEVLQGGDPNSDDHLFAMKNLVASLVHRPLLGTEIVDARKSLRRVQERIRGVRETPVRYQIWWIEALLHTVMEEYRQAEAHFLQARNGFLRIEQFTNYALATIDFIEMLLKRGDGVTAEVALARTAKELREAGANPLVVAAFTGAEDIPLEDAVEFLRARVFDGGGA